MRNALPWIVAGVLVAIAWVIVAREHRDHEIDRSELMDRIDSLRIENAALAAEAQALDQSAKKYKAFADSLGSIQPQQQIDHAVRLMSDATVDECRRVLLSRPR